MAERRVRRNLEIQDNLLRLDNLNPFYMPPGDVLRPFIDELLKNMVAEAIDLKGEKNFRESAILLHQCLLVYVQHIYPLGLEIPEDEKRVLEIRMFKAAMSVYSGIFQWAIAEAKFVAEMIDLKDQYTERRKEAQLIITVSKAGLDLLKYREKGISKIELERQQRILHRLNGTGQEAMLNLMIKELDKELGPYQESAEAEANKTEAPDLAWIPEGVKKHQEKVEANKTKKQEKKKKSRSRPSRQRSDSVTTVSSDDTSKKRSKGPRKPSQHEGVVGGGGDASSSKDVKFDEMDSDSESPTNTSGYSKSSRRAVEKNARHQPTKNGSPAAKVVNSKVSSPAVVNKVFKPADPVQRVQYQDGVQPPKKHPQRSSQQIQRPSTKSGYGLDDFQKTEAHLHRPTPPQHQATGYQQRKANFSHTHSTPQQPVPPPIAPTQTQTKNDFEALSRSLSPMTRLWLQKFQFRLACTSCFVQDSRYEGIQAFNFLPRENHVCVGDLLICQLKSLGEEKRIWGRIRQRTNPNFAGNFRLCQTFFQGLRCQIGYNLCHYAHSQEEMVIWQAERQNNFNGKELVAFLRQQLIQLKQSQRLASQQRVEVRTAPQMPLAQLTPPRPAVHKVSPAQPPAFPAPVKEPEITKQISKKASQQEKSTNVSKPATKAKKISPEKASGHTSERSKIIEDLIQNLQGYFLFCCQQCFHGFPGRISVQHPKKRTICTNNEQSHQWNINNRVLVFFSYNRQFWEVRPRPPNRPARVSLCWHNMKHYGCKHGHSCSFAHNNFEVEFWEFEQRTSFIPRDEVVELCQLIHQRPAEQKKKTLPAPKVEQQSTPSTSKVTPPFKYELQALCGICYPQKISVQNANNPKICSMSAHPWRKSYAIYQLLTTSNKWVRVYPRNPKLRASVHPILCRHGSRCSYRESHNSQCMFCHYPEEVALWVYQRQYSLSTIAEVIAVREKGGTNAGSSVSNSQPAQDQRQVRSMSIGPKGAGSQFFCSYCKKSWDEKWQLEQHLKAPDHLANINSDREKKWEHRDPPPGVTNGDYKICKFDQSGMCRYSGKRDEDNICDLAHGEDELKEWKERHKYRMMKMKKVREQRLFSFLDELLQAYNFTNQKETVMMKALPGVEVKCEQDLEVSMEIKEKTDNDQPYKTRWQFQVHSEKKKLKRIGLLYDEHRQHFYLSRPSDEERPQICPGSRLVGNSEWTTYSFEVFFTSEVLGGFHQWVVLDFGKNPALYVPLQIKIGSEDFTPQFSTPAISFMEPWNTNNSVIVEYPERYPKDPFYLSLKEKYPPPVPCDIVLEERHQMRPDNVKDHYHKMLYLEELACNDRLKKFSGWTKLELFDTITENGYYKAQGGELYAKISLTDSLLDDSEASQIVVSNVRFALIKFDEASEKVYQGKILTEKHLDLRKADSLYVSLGMQCVQEQKLEPNKSLSKVLVQFQLERISFCEMHFGVDNLTEMKLIFPPANMVPRFPGVRREECIEMNPRQADASKYIVGAGKSLPFVPGPTLIIGPFGTGKTLTLALTIIKLLDQSPNNKILVCTHSNSAADWLITEYLHPHLTRKKGEESWYNRKLLRVYATIKSPASVKEVIRDNYAIFEEGVVPRTFRKPTHQDVIGCNIVIATLATSIHLVALQEGHQTVKGYFKYIIIDEAGQALETEAIIPLGLAIENTVVVLAGDHIQMRPKVYSEMARNFNFHISMLEREFYWYKRWRCKNTCFLTYNYRMVKEILDFIARYHYQSPLVAKGDHYRHHDYHPMSFLTVKGNDQLIGTSYINMAEVNAIVQEVQELARRWPHQWGDLDIAVLTPYRLQVDQIRNKLRAVGLGKVNVEGVQNVQGKQFRAVFISTVRTRNTLNKAQITAISNSGQAHNEQYYYGFLSDEGELITAITRCQCLLYVIGDPIALCSVGDCHGTWEKYIKECQENYSLFPIGTTLQSIKQEIEAAKQQLNPFASSFQPIERRIEEPKQVQEPAKESSPYPKPPAMPSAWTKGPPKIVGTSSAFTSNPSSSSSNISLQRLSSSEFPPLYEPTEEVAEDEFGDYEEELEIDDDILKELRKQVQKDERTLKQDKTLWDVLEEATEQSAGDGNDEDDNDSFILHTSGSENEEEIEEAGHDEKNDDDVGIFLEPIDQPPAGDDSLLDQTDALPSSTGINFHMVERDGGIYLVRGNANRPNLQSARDNEVYDSDEDEEVRETRLNQDDTDDWLQKTVEHPEQYKICVVRFEPTGRVYAVLADGSSTEEIIISSKRRRERALDGDKVVIHILSETEGDYETLPLTQADDSKPTKLYGEVKHILERSVNPKFKKFVCTIDQVNYDLMCPVDRSSPKMFPMGRKKGEKRGHGSATKLQIYKIRNQGNGVFEKDRIVSVSYQDKSNQLFVVQYYEWFPNTPYPMGLVTEVLPPCDSPRNGMRILKLMHGVKDNWHRSLAHEIEEQFPDNWEIPKSELIIRAGGDFRNKDVFTVDPPESKDLDDALHVEKLTDGRLRVGVHIADVSYFIKKGSNLDKEASKRGVTFYPHFHAKASHMLPTQFSTNLCSLLPSKDRLTLTVLFTFNKSGALIGDPEILRSVVCSVQRLSYGQVEVLLADQIGDQDILPVVRSQLKDLQNLTAFLRAERLGDGRFFNQPDEGEQEAKNLMAHTLVEEMMILANEVVGNYLVKNTGRNVPVRCQPPPDPAKAQDWLTNFGNEADAGLKLSSVLPLIKEVTNEDSNGNPLQHIDGDEEGSIPDSDVSDFSMEDDGQEASSVPLTKATWQNIRNTLANDNHSHLELQYIIGNEGGHPKQAVALSHLYKILGNALYTNASDQQHGCHHFSLQKDFYTHFTSPIRRFIDLVVHRMLVASLKGEEPPYSARELDEICHHCNNQTFKANKFGKMTQCLLMALKLKVAAEPKLSFIESANDSGLRVLYPHERYLQATRSSTSIPLKHLKPSKKPDDGETINSVILQFKNSIYDYKAKVPEIRARDATLKTDRFIQPVPKSSWTKILSALKDDDELQMEDLLYEMVRDVEMGLSASEDQSSRISEITSEVDVRTSTGDDVAPKKYVDFRCDFESGQVVQVQLTAGLEQGLLVPKIQLFNMSPKFNFCIEHRENPIICFAKLAEKPPDKCKTVTQYVESWLPLVEMMVVHNTVSGDETTYIRDVPVEWFKEQRKNGSVVKCGCFSLKMDWCNDRNIKLYLPQKGKHDQHSNRKKMTEDDVAEEDLLARSYLCIRVHGHTINPSTQMKLKKLEHKPGSSFDTTNPHSGSMSLVIHAVTSSVTEDKKNDTVNIVFEEHYTSCEIPDELFDQTKKSLTLCTIEMIPKSSPDRRVEQAVVMVADTKVCRNLIRHICLQRPLIDMNNVEDSDVVSKYLLRHGPRFNLSQNIPGLNYSPPNESQKKALQFALSNTFTVIQGPPGTGKTRTGAYLAYFFSRINQSLPCNPRSGTIPQILYCGPSNKSVDVITEYLKEFMRKKDDFSIVRVYSESIEQQDFPMPGVNRIERKFGSKDETKMDPRHSNISLHHRIRAESSRYGHDILTIERKLRDGPVRITKAVKKEIKTLKKLIAKAMTEELMKHHVILCTCNASGRRILTEIDTINIVQVIIDEAGMCSEPDTLIPLVNHNPSQVVLIGDHMQLRPIIQEPHARELGAETSLMEKYQRYEKRAITLNIQYRMHEEICHFPSEAFYEGELQTAEAVKKRIFDEQTGRIWPNGPDYPRVFCHIVGVEEMLTVRSEEGNEMSRSNPLEIYQVVRIAKFLVNRLKVRPGQLAILSQYRLQCSQIEEKLKAAGLTGIHVSTVIKSQGSEWDYVIFSTVRSMSKIEIEDRPGKGWKIRHLGFTMDENQMNVAMTRARRGHIVVGNKFLLGTLDKWKDLFEIYEETNSLLPASTFLSY
ncbi:3'-5' exoribonuclease HELZ2-like isoform X2 [Apostichopus japonicus]|uniref:3'-5' exoribonuclease HELZ2-like isoform X2 n=1 Tax=Stichopus japonicus TaxID=307972 RepID=UPI003AB554CB